jgi:predicted phage terminase large subunit-like protein
MTQASYKPTARQSEALRTIGSEALHILLEGGSRSGKTFIACRAIVVRALAAPGSRHAIFRFRFSHAKASIGLDTLPKVFKVCFPGVEYKLDKTDWVFRLPNGSEIWVGGLDDKDRVEKVLGLEFATIYLNESSQIPYASRNMAVTRLAQRVTHTVGGVEKELRLKMIYDCNPPSQAHWTYQLWHRGVDPDTKQPVDRQQYARLLMNPKDNAENLPGDYIPSLEKLPERMRLRFLEGRYGDITENALWNIERIEQQRVEELPDMQRIVVSIDPSGAGDEDNEGNDEIGIAVCGLGVDGNGYVLEDLTVKTGPAGWGRVATTAFERHAADIIVGESNFGGAMVKFVVQTSKPGVPFKMVTASRGKVVRAEPISALTEQGKIRFAGRFNELEEELCAFTTGGYIGSGSPNRADAVVWGMTELFPGLTKVEKPKREFKRAAVREGGGSNGWMAG